MNAILKGALEFKHSITLYIPTADKKNKPLQEQKVRHAVLKGQNLLSASFGGCNTDLTVGHYIDSKGNAIVEDIYKIQAYAPKENFLKHLDKALNFMVLMKKTLNQESVAVEINGSLNLI